MSASSVATRRRLLVVIALVVAAVVASACGDGDDEPPPAVPTATSTATATPASTPTANGQALVARADGFDGLAFGTAADGAIAWLTDRLGPATTDSGWGDPGVPGTDPLRPGCPGREARLLEWPGRLTVVLTDWDPSPTDHRVGTGRPVFAGYLLWRESGITTDAGATPGEPLGRLREVYGNALVVSTDVDVAVGLPWWSLGDDGRARSPLEQAPSIRGWAYPPGSFGSDPGQGEDSGAGPVDDSWLAGPFTVGVSCQTP